jgi:hypothetical protein
VIVLNWRMANVAPMPAATNFQFVVPEQDLVLRAPVTNPPVGTVYQWRLNGTNLPGATNRNLILPTLQLQEGGDYTVVVQSGGAPMVSPAARLVVNELAYGWMMVDGQPLFTLTGRSSHRLRLDATGNWKGWTPVAQTPEPGAVYLLHDTNSVTQPKRFYRLTPMP